MAEPKKQRSHSRTRRAAAEKKAVKQSEGKCPECGKPTPSHRRCLECVTVK